jgi:hypothetical protein
VIIYVVHNADFCKVFVDTNELLLLLGTSMMLRVAYRFLLLAWDLFVVRYIYQFPFYFVQLFQGLCVVILAVWEGISTVPLTVTRPGAKKSAKVVRHSHFKKSSMYFARDTFTLPLRCQMVQFLVG